MRDRYQPLESTIVDAVRKAIAREFPDAVCRKRHVTMGVMGDPDLFGCLFGVHFEIEVKRPGEHPTKLQEQRLKEWAAAGAITGVAHSAEEALLILRKGGACVERK